MFRLQLHSDRGFVVFYQGEDSVEIVVINVVFLVTSCVISDSEWFR